MGLLDKLTNEGSSLSAYDGATPSTNPLATQQSKWSYKPITITITIRYEWCNPISISR